MSPLRGDPAPIRSNNLGSELFRRATLSEYADIEAIKQLKARYFRLMDTKDWDGMAQVFAPDVQIDMTGADGTVHTSVADFMPYLRQNIADVITVHHGHMPEITLLSETT